MHTSLQFYVLYIFDIILILIFLIFTDGFRGARDNGSNIVPGSSNGKKLPESVQNPDDPISDESGVGHEEEEAELLLELLSNIRTPKVSFITSVFIFSPKN